MRESVRSRSRKSVAVRGLLFLVAAIIVSSLPLPSISTQERITTSTATNASTYAIDQEANDELAVVRPFEEQAVLKQAAVAAAKETQASITPLTTTYAASYALDQPVNGQLTTVQLVEAEAGLGRTAVTAPQTANTTIPLSALPATIKVGRTFTTGCGGSGDVQRVDVVAFKDYVQNVLPHEWIPSWPDAALEAGAVAVAQYAIATMQQGKWSGRGFDVLDNVCDQIYKDRQAGLDYSRTDAAIDRMWGVLLTHNGQIFPTYYRAHSGICPANQPCMGQTESANLAYGGLSAMDILSRFYGSTDQYGATPAQAQPVSAPAAAAPANPSGVGGVGLMQYTVVPGDTLSGIARRLYGNPTKWHSIFEANQGQLINPHRIFPGQVLLYSPTDQHSAAAAPAAAANSSSAVFTGFVQHTVAPGETLSQIAQRFYGNPAKWNLIFEANRGLLYNPHLLYPGQVLSIPQ
jgi:LysM repeat protein